MGTTWRRLVLLAAGLVLTAFVVFVVNQTAQVVALASTVDARLGRAVLVALLLVYAACVLVPVVLIARLPRALRPPPDEHAPEFEAHLAELARRLARNPRLAGAGLRLDDRAGVEAAIARLGVAAEAMIRSTATTVFVATAISQNGRLDALTVLAAQSRLVWQLAHLYHQRPALRELAQLYANVAATVLLVTELDDMDVHEQVEPVITSALAGSLASVVPGASIVASMVTQAILEGAANAFLTLRIGVICQRYCAPVVAVERRSVRRFASVAAARMLGQVVGASAGVVAGAVLGAARKAGAGTLGTVLSGMSGLGERLNPLRRGPGRA
jgi:hypothetical protein